MHHEARSRRLNAALFGSPAEMACARLHRHRRLCWPLVVAVNLWFCARYGEPYGHVARIALRERLRRVDDADARFRLCEGG